MDGFWYRVLSEPEKPLAIMAMLWCFYLAYKTDSLELRIQKLETRDRRQER